MISSTKKARKLAKLGDRVHPREALFLEQVSTCKFPLPTELSLWPPPFPGLAKEIV